jgi:hypothetical protein
MRSIVPVFILLLAEFCCVSCRTTHDPRATWTPGEGYEYLIVARRFALGGVGAVGQTSTGEYAFRAVLRSRSAPDVFRLVFSPGAQATEEGKLYALCGIRATDRSAFDSYAAILLSTNAEVTTQRGCSVGGEKVADVVKQISDGVYDSYFSKR